MLRCVSWKSITGMLVVGTIALLDPASTRAQYPIYNGGQVLTPYGQRGTVGSYLNRPVWRWNNQATRPYQYQYYAPPAYQQPYAYQSQQPNGYQLPNNQVLQPSNAPQPSANTAQQQSANTAQQPANTAAAQPSTSGPRQPANTAQQPSTNQYPAYRYSYSYGSPYGTYSAAPGTYSYSSGYASAPYSYGMNRYRMVYPRILGGFWR